MKSVFFILSFAFSIMLIIPTFAAENATVAAGQEQPVKTVEVGNKICPVSGEKVVMGHEGKIEYQGKVYNLCCQMCEKDFKKDPQKYIEKLQTMEQEAAGSEQAK